MLLHYVSNKLIYITNILFYIQHPTYGDVPILYEYIIFRRILTTVLQIIFKIQLNVYMHTSVIKCVQSILIFNFQYF